jgi:CIC family chloride channel protein
MSPPENAEDATPQEETHTRLRQARRHLIRSLAGIGFTGTPFLIGLSLCIGVICGIGSLVFKWFISFFSQLLLIEAPALLGTPYALPLIVTLGFLVVTALVTHLSHEVKGAGIPEVMAAVATENGFIRSRVALFKLLASAVSIGSGGSVGREGPIVQIGSSIGSSVGQFLGLTGERLKLLVGCGAAAGISAAFNAPIAGGFFALEVILGDFSISTFSPILFASVMANAVTRYASADVRAFIVPEYQLTSLYELSFYFILALLSGFVAVAFMRILYGIEDLFEKLPQSPYARTALGGLIVGSIGLYFPQILGVGYDTITDILLNKLDVSILLVLLLVKVVATAVTLGAGASGGVFAPSLFIGAALGGAFGFLVNALFPGVTSPPGAYALVCMGAVVAGTTHAPLTAMLILFELTDDYQIILPLILATVISSLFARYLERESIYTLKLARRGLRVSQGFDLSVLESLRVRDAMSQSYDFVNKQTPLGEISAIFQNSNLVDFPIVDEADRLQGIISLAEIRPVVMQDDLYSLLIADDMMQPDPPYIEMDAPILEALGLFAEGDVSTLPVVENDQTMKLVGVLTHQNLTIHYHQEIQRRAR